MLMLTLTFYNDDVLVIPESAIANFKALGITNTLRFKHEHWIASSHAQAVMIKLLWTIYSLVIIKSHHLNVTMTCKRMLFGNPQKTTKVSINTKPLQQKQHQMVKFCE